MGVAAKAPSDTASRERFALTPAVLSIDLSRSAVPTHSSPAVVSTEPGPSTRRGRAPWVYPRFVPSLLSLAPVGGHSVYPDFETPIWTAYIAKCVGTRLRVTTLCPCHRPSHRNRKRAPCHL